MKSLILTILLITLTSIGYSQKVIRLKTTQVAIIENNQWSDFKDCSLLIVFDFDNLTIKVYSDIQQYYQIVDIESDYETKGMTKMKVVDSLGKELEVFTYLKEEVFSVMVFYPHKKFGYTCYKMD